MKPIVIKLGGHLLDRENFLGEFAQDIQRLTAKIAVLHGGGPAIRRLFDAFGEESRFVNGLRATNEFTVSLVEMALSGQVNKMLTRSLGALGVPAVGISGADGKLICAEPIGMADRDSNRVGKVRKISPDLLQTLWAGGWVPVISPVGVDAHGRAFNINADSAAYALASAISASALIFLSDVPGILWDGRVVPELTPARLQEGLEQGIIHSGMIPKLEKGFQALRQVGRILISTWQGPRTLIRLLERKDILFTELEKEKA